MSDAGLRDFLATAGDRLYRELVQHHLRKQKVAQMRDAVMGEAAMLPGECSLQSVAFYVNDLQAALIPDQAFWASASCSEAFARIIIVASRAVPGCQEIATVEEALKPENQELAFALFQIATVSLAYAASFDRRIRQHMGICKGLFG